MKSYIQFESSHHPLTQQQKQQQQEGGFKFEVFLAPQADHSTNYSLELSLGIPSTSGTTATSSRATSKAWTIDPSPETQLPNGFIHPWSLAARQQKAVLEQSAHHEHNHSSTQPSFSSSSSFFLPRYFSTFPIACMLMKLL